MKTSNSKPRRGFTMIELVVACGIMMVIMTVVTSLTFRIHGVWQDTNQQRIALSLVSCELERLTSMPADEIPTAIESLQDSDAYDNALSETQWSGDVLDDELGSRVVLRLNWNRRHPGKPVELVGWLLESGASS